MNDFARNLLVWVVIVLVVLAVLNSFGPSAAKTKAVTYSDFLTTVEKGNVKSVSFDGLAISGSYNDGGNFTTYSPVADFGPLVDELRKDNPSVQIDAKAPEQPSWIWQALLYLSPAVIMIVFWFYIMRQMQGGGGRGAMSFGKSRARMLGEYQVKITFSDVAGV